MRGRRRRRNGNENILIRKQEIKLLFTDDIIFNVENHKNTS
jgi:hypothetical protein